MAPKTQIVWLATGLVVLSGWLGAPLDRAQLLLVLGAILALTLSGAPRRQP